jgi:hypothetical protein
MKFKDISIPENSIVIKVILWLLFLLLFTLSFFSEGSAGGADTYVRFFYARESWNSPELFMHFWAKPVYVLLASPFAQFGYDGIKVFNILLGILSAYAAFRIAKNYGIRFRIAAIFLVLFAPVYMFMLMSAMTEILFGAILITAVWQYSEKRYIMSAVLISFIIHVRTEGMIFLLLWALIYIINKKYKQLPFLLSGFLIYSIIGMFYVYHDFFWFFTQNIYTDYVVDYGSGPLLYYAKGYDFIFGTYMTVLVLLGLMVYLYLLIRSVREKKFASVFTEASLLAGIPLLYFVMHSVFWWKGLFHVLGDIRFMAAIIPLSALIAIKGIDFIFKKIQSGILVTIITVAAIVPAMITPFNVYQFPVPLYDENYEMNKTVEWLKTTPYFSNRILFYNPVVPVLLDRNPLRDTTMMAGILTAATTDSMKAGDILIWDTHFAGAEGMVSHDALISDVNFELIRSFQPDVPFQIFNGQNFYISVFRKLSDNMKGERKFVNDTLFYCDFNDIGKYPDATENPPSSGNRMLPLNINRIYSPTLDTSLTKFPEQLLLMNAKAEVWFPAAKKTQIFLVASVENEGVARHYASKTFEGEINAGINSIEINSQYYLPEIRNMRLKVYAYTADSQEVYINKLVIMKKRQVVDYE